MKIPSSSISRLSLYYRSLVSIKEASVISSEELSSFTGCSASQIRKDLAYFGQFGKRGLGYSIPVLKEKLSNILGIDRIWNVALIGVGNLGSALLSYKGFKEQGFNIVCAFDNDKKKLGHVKGGMKIEDIKDLKKIARSKNVSMAIIAVSGYSAKDIIDKIISSGIKAILNFAPIICKAPSHIKLLNIDLSMELEKLTYFLKRSKN
ncbi:MAG: redox-sensing transcriptional repressor Rex [Candidatus Omnitrophota bacterium]